MEVHWHNCTGDKWCPLMNLTLDFQDEGVYFIWHSGTGKVVYVGQGRIVDRIRSHRTEAAILKHGADKLLVTWADVPSDFRDGVERYLADYYQPLEGERHPAVAPILVNLP